MKIVDGQLALSAQSLKTVQQEQSEKVRVWVSKKSVPTSSSTLDTLDLSSNAAPQPTAETAALDAESQLDPKLQIIKAEVEALTGRKIKLVTLNDLQHGVTITYDDSAATAPAPQGWGMDATATQTTTETQQLAVQASGAVATQDGREINFSLQVNVQQQSVSEQTQHVQAGDAAVTDPLVLNLHGVTGELAGAQGAFDLNGDGKAETLPVLPSGHEYLVLDKNGDGTINNGSELFGPTTGNGFAELAQYDTDGNHWIDENDAAFSKLGLWDGSSAAPVSLTSQHIGAIALESVAAPLALNDANNNLTGIARTAGVFLQEDGTPGIVQQLDLVG